MSINLKNISLLAFGCAFCYAFGLVFFVLVFPEAFDQSNLLNSYLAKQTLYEIWITVIYMVFALLVLYLSFCLKEKDSKFNFSYTIATVWAAMLFGSGSIALLGIETVANKTESNAQQLWETLSIIQNALGGGIEFVAGLWSISIAKAVCKTHTRIAFFGVFVGIVGLLTLFSVFRTWVMYFGILQLLFFVGLGMSFGIKKQDI